MIFMTGMGLAFGNIMTNGQNNSLEEQPDANAIFNTLQQFAGAVGTTLASLIVAMSQANQKMDFTQATAKGSRNGFMVFLPWASSNSFSYFGLLGKNKIRINFSHQKGAGNKLSSLRSLIEITV